MPLYDLPRAELLTYRSSVQVPPDFDSFWQTTLEEARSQAKPPRFVSVKCGLSLIEVFDATYSGYGGHDVKAWLILPRRREGRLPAVVEFIGYGSGRGFPHEHLVWPAAGYALFVMDSRGQGRWGSRGDTSDPVGSGPAVSGVMTRGIDAPENYYYRRIYADAVRAVEVVLDHPAVDPGRVAVAGISQGGGISLAVSGLVKGLAGVMANVPFLSDFPRAITLASNGPYLEISRYFATLRSHVDETLKTLSYFDAVCFVRHADAPALVSVALMDAVCPPSTVFAAFNAYAASDKTMIEYPFNDHEGGAAQQAGVQLEWLAARLPVL